MTAEAKCSLALDCVTSHSNCGLACDNIALMLASISLNAGCSIKYASYNRYRSNVVLKNEKLRLSPKYSLCSLGSTSFGRRGYIIKPLTVENHFPKFEKPVDPPTELKFKKSEKVRCHSLFSRLTHAFYALIPCGSKLTNIFRLFRRYT